MRGPAGGEEVLRNLQCRGQGLLSGVGFHKKAEDSNPPLFIIPVLKHRFYFYLGRQEP